MTKIDFTRTGPVLGGAFPDLELPDQHGRPIRLHEWRRRRALVVFYRSDAW